MKLRWVYGIGCVFGAVASGCGGGSNGSGSNGGAAGENMVGTGGATMTMMTTEPARTCGGLPVITDYWLDTPDECMACLDTECCDEAQACADNPDCMALRECYASCPEPGGDCVAACDAMTIPPENAAFTSCRNSCRACLDFTTCTQSEAPAPSEASYPVTVHVQSYTAGDVVFPGVTFKVCALSDVECANPLSQGVTDAEGNVPIDVPSAPRYTDAYFEITGPNVESTRVHMRYAEGAETRLESGKLTLPLLDSPTATALRGAMQATADQSTVGFVSVFVYSCAQRGASGVIAESSAADASTILQYMAGAAPSATATATDTKGIAFFADHPEGATTITARFADNGEVLGTADLYVRAGFLNSIFVLPTL